jgi:prolyl-tRNA synthetase
MSSSITTRATDYNQWYLDVIAAADLADYGPVKGTMVIKPWGYRIWELMQAELDKRIKETGTVNAYFPLFIPESFLHKEASHVEGFAPEVAVVTHAGGEKLEEPVVVRPTSETIIYHSFSKWIQSYRDLPLKINQWANVVRWEMRTRLFLRTSEFLWQEGHTVHATEEEADQMAHQMLGVYHDFVRDWLAFQAVPGRKSEAEKFAGAVYTLSIEALMQDGKALQSGTSHQLGQNFSRAFDVKFLSPAGVEIFGWQTSWGVSTRLIGGLIMAHSDDAGLVLPPTVAPYQVVIVPIGKDATERQETAAAARQVIDSLPPELRCHIDDREHLRLGEKIYEWEKKGVPLRVELGPRDLQARAVVVSRRDTGEKKSIPVQYAGTVLPELLDEIQQNLLSQSESYLTNHRTPVATWEEFKSVLEEKGGFVEGLWCGQTDCEKAIQTETKATVRCLPFDKEADTHEGSCIHCGEPATQIALFAKAY